MELGLIYNQIIRKLYDNADMDKRLYIADAKKIISITFRMSNKFTSTILHELSVQGMIKFDCVRSIIVVWDPQED